MENKKRMLYLDIAKGFAIIFMFTQHCILVHGIGGGESDHWLSDLLFLSGTAPAAPVFMLIMGIFIMKSRGSMRSQILRGVKLLLLGYFLNILRFPMFIPEGDFSSYSDFFLEIIFQCLTANDILQMAGLSLIVGAVLKKVIANHIFSPILFITIFLVSPFLWGLFPDNPFLLILWGITENTFFPFFPWVVYPLLGMYMMQYLLREGDDLDNILNKIVISGIVFALAGGIMIIFEVFPVGDYSRSGIGIHMLIIGFVFVWLKICRIIEIKLTSENIFIKELSFLSVNITMIYFIQWILFSWSIFILGANNQNPYIALLVGVVIFIITRALANMNITRKVFRFTRV